MEELMTLDQLVTATNAAIGDMDVADGRVAEAITERNVRYYVTLGLVRPPVRDGGRSLWTHDHVNDLIRIRRAQSLGRSLKQIPSFRSSAHDNTWRLANVAAEFRSELVESVLPQRAGRGWSVRISPSVVLAGFTELEPTETELQAVRNALGRVLGA